MNDPTAVCGPVATSAGPWRGERFRHVGLFDVAFTLVLGLIILVGSHPASHAQPDRHGLDAWGHVLLASAVATVLLRRVATRLFLFASTAVAGVYLAFGYPYGPILLAVAAASASVAARYDARTARPLLIAAGVVIIGAAFVGESYDNRGNWFGASVQLGWVLIPAIIGTFARSARLSAMSARGEATRRADEESRLRLAREVHDVVGHDLSVISLQAGVALHLLERDPEQVRAALDAIRRTSTDALDELRTTLAMTRGDTVDARRDTGAGLARLPGIVSGLALCGLTVSTAVHGLDDETIPTALDVAAFRVVQESLTNVLRHSAARTATVLVTRTDHVLLVDVSDPGPERAGTQEVPGRGLTGLSERLAEVGGTLSAGPDQNGWRVLARIPWEAGT